MILYFICFFHLRTRQCSTLTFEKSVDYFVRIDVCSPLLVANWSEILNVYRLYRKASYKAVVPQSRAIASRDDQRENKKQTERKNA